MYEFSKRNFKSLYIDESQTMTTVANTLNKLWSRPFHIHQKKNTIFSYFSLIKTLNQSKKKNLLRKYSKILSTLNVVKFCYFYRKPPKNFRLINSHILSNTLIHLNDFRLLCFVY